MEMFRDSQYMLFQDSLDSQIKYLTRSGLNKQWKQAKPITEEDNILWSKGLLGDNEPKMLVNTLVYLFGKFFALCSGEEHKFDICLEVIEGDEEERT